MADAILTKRDGVVSMDKSFDFLCSTLRNGVYTVKIIRKTEPRTISQNSLMWMWYKCMEEATGTPKEDFHDYYKAKWDKEKEDVYVEPGKKALIGPATLTCKYGGIIKIITSGQPE